MKTDVIYISATRPGLDFSSMELGRRKKLNCVILTLHQPLPFLILLLCVLFYGNPLTPDYQDGRRMPPTLK